MGSSYQSAASLLRTGPSRPTLYEVDVPFVETLGQDASHKRSNEHLRLFCRAVSIPGIAHDVVSVAGYKNMGVGVDVPVGMSFASTGPVVMSLIENSDWTVYRSIRRLFERSIAEDQLRDPNGPRNLRMNYYDDLLLKGKLEITKLEFANDGFDLSDATKILGLNQEGVSRAMEQLGTQAGYKKVCKFSFHNAYFTSVTDVPMATESFDQPLSYAIAFNYETYSCIFFNDP